MIHVASGTLFGEPFDLLEAQANLMDQLVTIPSATLTAGSARVDLSAEFRHPRDSFRSGTIHARLRTNSIDMAQVHSLKNQPPSTAGSIQLPSKPMSRRAGFASRGSPTATFNCRPAPTDGTQH